MLALYIEAPFAVCRTFTAGWYRPTATFLTPSAAYGLLLNLAGVETRLREEDATYPGSVPATLTLKGLPAVKVAVGAAALRRVGRRTEALPEPDRYPRVQTVYQQLHNYPVGASGAERAATTFGNKYNISPVRRELLVGLRAVVALNGNSDLEASVRSGLAGELSTRRYGLPFVGDNAFLPDRIELLDNLLPAHWYEQVTGETKVRPRTTRLTIWIDRADLSRTRSQLYAPTTSASATIPPGAWTAINPV
jgi:CRISPR-associated protein Cas5t